MYHHLDGRLFEKNPTSAVIDVSGVGYSLLIPLSTFSALPALGERVRLLTHFLVREDAHVLCGFYTEEERELFRLLISVSGIGPKVAMTALSGIPASDLKAAIARGEVHVLTGISGIGRKTAERLVVELKEKIVIEKRELAAVGAKTHTPEREIEDSLQALMSLGYKKANAKAALEKALKDNPGETPGVENLIRAALKNI